MRILPLSFPGMGGQPEYCDIAPENRIVTNVKNADVSSDSRIEVMYPHAAPHPRLVRGSSKYVSSDLHYEKGR